MSDLILSVLKDPYVLVSLLLIFLFALITGIVWCSKCIDCESALQKARELLHFGGAPIGARTESSLKIGKDLKERKFTKEDLENPFIVQVRDFLEQCQIHRDKNGLESHIHAEDAFRLRDYFDQKKIRIAFYRAFSNIIVGVGLVITFGLLAIVVSNAGGVLQNGSESSKALQDLLHQASSKFLISATAIACSVVYGLLFRGLYLGLERTVRAFAVELSNCVYYSTPESGMQNTLVNLLETISEKLEGGLATSIQRATAQSTELIKNGVQAEMRALKENMNAIYESAQTLPATLTSIVATIQSAENDFKTTQGIFQDSISVVKEEAAEIKTAFDGMKSNSIGMKITFDSLSKSIVAAGEIFTSNLEQTRQTIFETATKNYESTIEAATRPVVAAFEGVAGNVTTTFKDSLTGVKEEVAEIKTAFEGMKSNSIEMESTFNSLGESIVIAGEKFTSNLEQTRQTIFETATKNYESTIEAATRPVVAAFEGVAGSLITSSQLITDFPRQLHGIRDSFTPIEDSIKTLIRHQEKSEKHVSENIEEMAMNWKKIENIYENLKHISSKLDTMFASSVNTLSNHFGEYTDAQGLFCKNFHDSLEKAYENLQNIVNNTQQVQKGVTTQIENLHGEIRFLASNLHGDHGLNHHVANLAKSLEEQAQRDGQFAQNLVQLHEAVSSLASKNQLINHESVCVALKNSEEKKPNFSSNAFIIDPRQI